eukprot:TRINITY_DN7720_c3_g1_i1.p1 TRINITY_DN7720_c3_g1~~TRINITY_DN7720_c3_g1_i1.p1  ORF type:complete len:966 (+),score=179.00 TRINITY_DN7720_c3_g1_i1:38-2899(+)
MKRKRNIMGKLPENNDSEKPTEEPRHEGWKVHLSDDEQQGLKRHQLEGIGFMWKCIAVDKKGCLLAHEMGLGKTRQVLSLFWGMTNANLARMFTAVLPNTLVLTWEEEAKKWFPAMKLYRFVSTQTVEERLDVLTKWRMIGGVLLTTYSKLANTEKTETEEIFMKRVLFGMTDVAVFDESQKVKNVKTSTHEACREFKTELRVAITGTPLMNAKEDVLTLIDFVRPNYYNTSELDKFLQPVVNSLRNSASEWEVAETHSRANTFINVTRPIIHRRSLARNVDAELPALTHYICKLRLSSLQASLYSRYATYVTENSALKEQGGKNAIAACFTSHQISYHPSFLMGTHLEWFPEYASYSSQQAAWMSPTPEDGHTADWEQLSPKILVTKQIVQEAVKLEERTLIFSRYPTVLENLKLYLLGNGICRTALVMSGKDTAENRGNMVQEFQKGEIDVLLLTIGVGGVGLTLTKASRVILLEPTWTLADTQQAVFRTYRLGQKKPVFAYQLVADGTLETTLMLDKMLKKDWIHKRLIDDTTATRDNFVLNSSRSITDKLDYQPSLARPVDQEILSMDHVMERVAKLTMEATPLIVSASTHSELLRVEELELDEYAMRLSEIKMTHIVNQYSDEGECGVASKRKQEPVKLGCSDARRKQELSKQRTNPNRLSRAYKCPLPKQDCVGHALNVQVVPPPRPTIDTMPAGPPPVSQAVIAFTENSLIANADSFEYVDQVLAQIGSKLINVEEKWVLQGLIFPKVHGELQKKTLVDFILWGVLKAGTWRFEKTINSTPLTRDTFQYIYTSCTEYSQWETDAIHHAPDCVKKWIHACKYCDDASLVPVLNLSVVYEGCFPMVASSAKAKNFTTAFREQLGLWEQAVPEWLKVLTMHHLRCRYFYDQIFEWGFNEVLGMVLKDQARGTSILRKMAANMAIPRLNTNTEFDGFALKNAVMEFLFPK